jgi:hypothetical protein
LAPSRTSVRAIAAATQVLPTPVSVPVINSPSVDEARFRGDFMASYSSLARKTVPDRLTNRQGKEPAILSFISVQLT